MRSFTELPPLSLYIHLPWCEKKCPYCDFNSHAVRDNIHDVQYVDALLADLAQDLPPVWGRPIETVFIGGGTPSLFSVDAINRLLSGVRALTNLLPGTEITLEANPGSAEAEKFRGFRDAGINRLSIGVQSFNDQHLQALGRVHNAAQAAAAIESARAAGFDSFNVDLMFALPNQTAAQASADLEQAIALNPAHISYYQLTLEPNTLFHSKPPSLPDDDLAWEMQEHGQSLLANAGYLQYEISAYAQQDRRCAHNLNYWQFGDYLGIGAGAHSKITHPGNGTITRAIKQRQPAEYMQRADGPERLVLEREVPLGDTGFEFMMNAMRLKNGVPTNVFLSHTGLPLARFQRAVDDAQQAGLLYCDIQRLRPTERGFLFLNDLLSIFMDRPAAHTIEITKNGPS